MRSISPPFVAALSFLLAGCATTHPQPSLEEVAAAVFERTEAHLPASAAAPAVDRILAGELTAEGAVQVALAGNRALHATLAEVGVAAADLDQARLVSNPGFHAELRWPGRPLEVGLTHDISDLWLRRLRARVGSARLRQTRLAVAHEVVELVGRVRAAFYQHQGALELGAGQRAIADAAAIAAALSGRQLAAGTVNQLEHENVQALYEEARLALAAGEAEAIETREHLNRLMGTWGKQTGWSAAERLPDPPAAEADLARLEALAVARRLDLQASAEDVAAAREALPLARSARFPAVAVGMHLEREPEGRTTAGPEIEISLPLFDRGQAAAAAARARLAQSLERRAALAVDIRSEVRAAHARLDATRRRLEYHRDVVVPRRERIVALTQREVNFMLAGVYDLLEARRNEIDARRGLSEARRDYWLARTELERAAGGRLDEAATAHAASLPAASPRPSEPASKEEEP